MSVGLVVGGAVATARYFLEQGKPYMAARVGSSFALGRLSVTEIDWKAGKQKVAGQVGLYLVTAFVVDQMTMAVVGVLKNRSLTSPVLCLIGLSVGILSSYIKDLPEYDYSVNDYGEYQDGEALIYKPAQIIPNKKNMDYYKYGSRLCAILGNSLLGAGIATGVHQIGMALLKRW